MSLYKNIWVGRNSFRLHDLPNWPYTPYYCPDSLVQKTLTDDGQTLYYLVPTFVSKKTNSFPEFSPQSKVAIGEKITSSLFD